MTPAASPVLAFPWAHKPLLQHAQCTPSPFLPLPFFFIYSDSLFTIPHNLSWILITAAVPIMLPLCCVSSLSLLRMRGDGVRSLCPRDSSGTQGVSRSSRRIPSCLRDRQREKGCQSPIGSPRVPAGMTGMPSLSFTSNGTTSAEERLCQGATVSGPPLQPDLSLADLLGSVVSELHLQIKVCALPWLHLAPVLNSDC